MNTITRNSNYLLHIKSNSKMDDAYKVKHPKPIPIGHQEFAYQCEDVLFDFLRTNDTLFIKSWRPTRSGKLPYPNDEIDMINEYELELKRHYCTIEIVFKKKYKDGRIGFYVTNISFSQFINRLFEGHSASSWIRSAPKQDIKVI